MEILLDNFDSESEDDVNPVFLKLKKHSNRTCDSVVDLAQMLEKGENKNEWKSVNLSVYTFQVILNNLINTYYSYIYIYSHILIMTPL